MIDELVVVEEPDDQTVQIVEHTIRLDGSVRLVLRVKDVDDPDVMLPGVGGTITRTGPDVLIEWTWPPMMLPPDEAALCIALVRRALITWASAFLGEQIPMDLLT